MIWQRCEGPQHIHEIKGTLFRLVESQEQVATLDLVDTLEEQALLEELLEDSKPDYPIDMQDYHYLLKTPFRYPPLKWGSRFGRVHEPSLFYGACQVETVLSEAAFYRFIFIHSMPLIEDEPSIRTEHTLFNVGYRTDSGVQLHKPPFTDFQDELIHAQHYALTQQLGSDMRAENVQAFEYCSARDACRGVCVALYSPTAFTQKKPRKTEQWLCEVNYHTVRFKAVQDHRVFQYESTQFYYNGKMPAPA